jgi:hypothetical protein
MELRRKATLCALRCSERNVGQWILKEHNRVAEFEATVAALATIASANQEDD